MDFSPQGAAIKILRKQAAAKQGEAEGATLSLWKKPEGGAAALEKLPKKTKDERNRQPLFQKDKTQNTRQGGEPLWPGRFFRREP